MFETENIRKVIRMLREHSDNREITVRDIKESPVATSYLGTVMQSPESITVYLNFSYLEKVYEAVTVHELLHVVLDYEGFPDVVIGENVARTLPPQLQNVI